MFTTTLNCLGIPDATVATTYNEISAIELEALHSASESMYAHSGGDGPERQLRALLRTLDVEHTDKDGLYSVMIPGSEIVLLTDAPSHDPELEDNVIRQATRQQVCISFYLSGSYALFDPYLRIASATGGTVVETIDRTSFRTFESDHNRGQCARFYDLPVVGKRKKRQTLSSSSSSSFYNTEQMCHYFTTSLLTTTVTVWGYTDQDAMVVTKPNGEEVRIIANFRGDKIYRDATPLHGQWNVCVEAGTLTISLEKTDSITFIIHYLTPIANSSELSLNYSPPPACKCQQQVNVGCACTRRMHYTSVNVYSQCKM